MPTLNIVLLEPEIPMNTGNIGRLCMASGCKLHLVKPFGFEIEDKRLKRAGLDYWPHLAPIIYESQAQFFSVNEKAGNTVSDMAFFSSHGKHSFWSLDYKEDQFLIFGKESLGLGDELRAKHEEQLYNIPLYSDKVRSLNLANSVGIVIYEGLRQLG